MWTTDSLWFEVAIVSSIFAVGNMTFGHFEEQTPKLRRIGKYLFTLLLITMISFYWGRTVAMVVLAAALLPVIYVHGFYCRGKKE